MKRRKTPAPRGAIRVPPHLRLGPLLEVFAPEAVPDYLAGRVTVDAARAARDRYRAARTAYLVSAGADPDNHHTWPVTGRRSDGRPARFPDRKPWSLTRARRDWPDQLDDLLRRCDLPLDWTPTPQLNA